MDWPIILLIGFAAMTDTNVYRMVAPSAEEN